MFRNCEIVVITLLCAFLFACTPEKTATTPDSPATPGDTGDGTDVGGGDDTPAISPFAQTMLAAINQERMLQLRPTLTWSTQLEQAALAHAQDMVDNNFFSHVGSNGSSVGARVTSTSYIWATVGENIANGQTSIEQVMAGWMNSPGHRENILSLNFSQVGVARVNNIWVQVFARPGGGLTKPIPIPFADG